jgi:two-component system chemotaxis response regulator CheB
VADLEAIVVGGSAGALDALLAILPALPLHVRVPIVIVLHLPPGRRSLVPDILSRASTRAAHEAEDKTALCERSIYVAPPNYHLLIERDRSLSLSVDPPVHHSRPAIDVLFESAALAYGPAVMGLLLSGANDDGSDGLACLRKAGGVAVIQDPATASARMMPEAARKRLGPGAHVAPLAELGAFIGRLFAPPLRNGRSSP